MGSGQGITAVELVHSQGSMIRQSGPLRAQEAIPFQPRALAIWQSQSGCGRLCQKALRHEDLTLLNITAVDAVQEATMDDRDMLLTLNRDYIASVQNSDVARFEQILADDFRCSSPDGTLMDRTQFLTQTARPVTISGLAAHDVVIRILGDVAIIHARTEYQTADGQIRSGRYTDIWARRGDRWLAVAAHVTR
jgi:ketosteroid isomerase-like protein